MKARRNGESKRRVETVSVAELVEQPRRVPRRVCSSCEGASETERSEYGDPRISKVASGSLSATISSSRYIECLHTWRRDGGRFATNLYCRMVHGGRSLKCDPVPATSMDHDRCRGEILSRMI